LVSPVFAAMFKPQFQEGIRFRLGLGEPITVPLPEDDAEAFLLLCKVIHHRSDEISAEPGISCLESLACICDKYSCTRAIANCCVLWLQKLIRVAPPDDLDRLLLVAYILDLPEFFSTISWEILLLQAGPFLDMHVLADHPLVRHDLLGRWKIQTA